MRLKQRTIKKSAQDRQDDIFRRMSADKKLKVASDFSMFILRLNKLSKDNGFSKTIGKNLRWSIRQKIFKTMGEKIKCFRNFRKS